MADAAVLGIPAEMVTETMNVLAGRTDEDDRFELLPGAAPIVERFLACVTQWRTAAMGLGGFAFLGLDYTACKTVLDGEGLAMTRSDWQGLRIMEGEAASAMNEKDSGA